MTSKDCYRRAEDGWRDQLGWGAMEYFFRENQFWLELVKLVNTGVFLN